MAENIRADADRAAALRKERAEKYPTCEKLAAAGDERRALLQFLEWLREEKKYVVAERVDTFSGLSFITQNDDRLVLEYLESDEQQLEEERRAMLEDLQEKAG